MLLKLGRDVAPYEIYQMAKTGTLLGHARDPHELVEKKSLAAEMTTGRNAKNPQTETLRKHMTKLRKHNG